MKLFDSELKVMDVLWRLGDRTAKEISSILGEETGWNVNTTYTVIKKCVAKGAVRRSEPNKRRDSKSGDGGAHRKAVRRIAGPALCLFAQQPNALAGADWEASGDCQRNEVTRL